MMEVNLQGKSILIAEDDPKIRNLIKIYLENAGFEVWEAEDGLVAKEMFETYDPCFVVMDLMMPHMSGEELCGWIREELKSDVPIIMLTAKVSEEDRIKGLQMGADDYVTKPFSPQELVVRVETVLKRTAQRCSKISYKGLTIKPLKGEVKFNGHVLPLTHHEYKLLYFFMRNPNQILTRDQILQELYPNDEKIVVERTIDVHVSKLREKMKEIDETSDFIETIRGMGYRFVAV
ncbi:response regulator transcription factor [Paenibacillus chondroitinus]|uniref:Response regulator transcription factor n=1 Tax=Paenibacillus chondroitinus TaxID=59842 RepID=A0ABU6DL35_9BACL|nr:MULTISPECIES: response regulator transcription factor [Paenibacillus]MCY9657160.1 response regulator transcription factor [Paenibacillus anseongense]MEB4798443.1 response regulator transcription factor [Paenibacillus chondroitinus]